MLPFFVLIEVVMCLCHSHSVFILVCCGVCYVCLFSCVITALTTRSFLRRPLTNSDKICEPDQRNFSSFLLSFSHCEFEMHNYTIRLRNNQTNLLKARWQFSPKKLSKTSWKTTNFNHFAPRKDWLFVVLPTRFMLVVHMRDTAPFSCFCIRSAGKWKYFQTMHNTKIMEDLYWIVKKLSITIRIKFRWAFTSISV